MYAQLYNQAYLASMGHSTRDSKDNPTINTYRVFAGGIAAATTKSIIAPLNRLTIIMQSQGLTSLKYSNTPAYTSIYASFRDMIKKEGFTSLWNGNGANVLRVLPNYGLRFALNDVAREFVAKLYGLDPDTTRHSLSHGQLLLSSSLAAVIQITLTYPIEVISTRLAVSGSDLSPVKYTSMYDCLSRTVRQEGLKSLFNGYPITLLAGTPYIALQMSCFELFQRHFHKLFSSDELLPPNNKQPTQIGVFPKLLAGALASITAQTLTYPGDVLRRRMQVDGMGSNKQYAYRGIIHASATILKNEGLKAFFKGIHVNSLRILPEGAIMFVMVDAIKKLMDIEKYDTH